MSDKGKDHFGTVSELIAERPAIDNTPVFNELRSIQDDLFAVLKKRFDLTLDPSSKRFQPYASKDGNATGSLHAFTGPGVDWLIYSWVGNPKLSFCNMHLTLWLGPETWAPHLAFAFGTFPVTFFLMDFVPRKDITIDAAYLKKYVEPMNSHYLRLRNDPRISLFVSQSAFVRAAVSPTGLNFIAQPGTEGVLDLIRVESKRVLDTWLTFLDSAEAVPMEQRAALRERDIAYRRNAAELDPANVVVENIYGVELAQGLVRALWGGDRENH